MAHALSITDGTTTFSLSTTNCFLVQYTPADPQKGEATVIESIEVLFYAASVAAMRTAIDSLQKLLDAARRRQAWGVGPVVYLLYQPDGDATAWRSAIVDARLEYNENTLRAWGQAKLPATLIVEHAAERDGDLTQLPLTNGNGSNNTSGLTVNSHLTASAFNYVQIAGGNVGGNLPAPVLLELTNNTGGSVTYYEVMLANNAFSDPANLTHLLQAETGIVAGGGTVSNDATCSNGQYVAFSFTGSAGQFYTLSQALLQDAQGYDFHLLARFRALNARAFVRPSIYEATGTYAIWSGDEVELPLISPALADLGVIPLPPGGYSAAWGALRLRLDWRAGTTVQVDTDYLAFFPTHTFRRLRVVPAVGSTGTIVDDGIEGRAYLRVSAVETAGVTPSGMPLLLWPGATQRIYFAWSLANWTAPIAQTFSVKAWYRPRRYSF